MPIGVIVNGLAILIGGLIGAVFGGYFKKDFCDRITMIFAISSMAMGICSIVRVENLPPVVLATILGTMIGELIRIERGIVWLSGKLQQPIAKLLGQNEQLNKDTFMVNFISLVVLFCASGTGIFGALQSGLNGNHTILYSKSILDFFTAAIFAANLGYIVLMIAFMQATILLALFCSASLIMPLVTPTMLNDFTACGGMMMLAAGFRIAGLREFPIASMIPSMALVMPLSYLWTLFTH